MRPAARRRQLSPFLLRKVLESQITQAVLCRRAGWPNYPQYFEDLRAQTIRATPQTVGRLQALADLVNFPKNEIFLDDDEPLTRTSATSEAVTR